MLGRHRTGVCPLALFGLGISFDDSPKTKSRKILIKIIIIIIILKYNKSTGCLGKFVVCSIALPFVSGVKGHV